MTWLKAYGRGFGFGAVCGAIFLTWIYRAARQFPGDPDLNRYYAWLRGLDRK